MTGVAANVMFESEAYRVVTFTGGNRWKVNAYLLTAKQSRRSLVIDPGSEPAGLLSALHELETSIECVLLTHGHFDHMTAAAAVCEEFAVPCLIHSADARLLRHAPFYAIRFDGTPVTVPSAVLCLDAPDAPDLAGAGIKMLAAPGHTPGGVFFAMDRIIFSGDTLLKEMVGRTDQPGGNRDDLIQSIELLLHAMPDETIIFPGHGKPWTVKAARAWWQGAAAEPPPHVQFI